MMRNYLIHFFIAVPLLAGLIAGFNWRVDPYAIYRDRETLMHQPQPLLVMNERVLKTVGLSHSKSDVVLLGTSVTDLGIGEGHPAFAGKRVMNLATFGQPIVESRRLMEIALAYGKPHTIVFGLDLLAFNELLATPTDYVEENYSSMRPYNLLLSISAMADSWSEIRHKQVGAEQCCNADGFRSPQIPSDLLGNYRIRFIANERVYFREKYLPYPECRFSSSRKGGGSSFNDLREMVKMAHQHHVDFRLFISPSHARQWETVAVAGLWDTWEEWKRELVRINEDEARHEAAQPFPLWDFSGYDSISSEAVPALGDTKSLMRWYTDSAHYTPELGKLVIARMFGTAGKGARAQWGVLLNSNNLNAQLARIRMERQAYLRTHAQDVAEVEATAREVNLVKHCPN